MIVCANTSAYAQKIASYEEASASAMGANRAGRRRGNVNSLLWWGCLAATLWLAAERALGARVVDPWRCDRPELTLYPPALAEAPEPAESMRVPASFPSRVVTGPTSNYVEPAASNGAAAALVWGGMPAARWLAGGLALFWLPIVAGQSDPQTQLDTLRDRLKVPALALAELRNGKARIWTTGVRRLGSPTPVRASDAFHLGSCAKSMTAAVIAIAVERGELNWCDKVVEVLGSRVGTVHPSLKNLNLGMLTAHHSGLGVTVEDLDDHNFYWDSYSASGTSRALRLQVAKRLLRLPAASVPGSTFAYSNANYLLAASMLEATTGHTWDSLIQTRLFQPLGMSGCGLGAAADPSVQPPNAPWPHELAVNGSIESLAADAYHDLPAYYRPAGGVHCPLDDWAKYVQWFMDGQRVNATSRLLTPQSFAVLAHALPDNSYTYGAWVPTTRRWAKGTVLTHGGSNLMNYATAWLAPEDNVAYLAATNVGGDPGYYAVNDAVSGRLDFTSG